MHVLEFKRERPGLDVVIRVTNIYVVIEGIGVNEVVPGEGVE